MPGRMFTFVTRTWNPVKFCSHHCAYCWARSYRYRMDQAPKLHEDRLRSRFSANDFVFVCDVADLFCNEIPSHMIEAVLEHVETQRCRFLLMTKNPARYMEFFGSQRGVETNLYGKATVYLGATIETDLPVPGISRAPSVSERLRAMEKISCRLAYPIFVSVEPIMDFSPAFSKRIIGLRPWGVAVGYDNYSHHLKEPTLSKTEGLIRLLEKARIRVYRKTIRESWS